MERQSRGQRAAPIRLVQAIGSEGEDVGLCIDGPGDDEHEWPYPALDGVVPMQKAEVFAFMRAPRASPQPAAMQEGALSASRVAEARAQVEALLGRCLLEAELI